jgi:elongation factor 1-alpha
LKNGDVAIVRIRPIGNLVLESADKNPHMARFAIRDAGVTVASGVCKSLIAKKL